jgi:hypothetical protein
MGESTRETKLSYAAVTQVMQSNQSGKSWLWIRINFNPDLFAVIVLK